MHSSPRSFANSRALLSKPGNKEYFISEKTSGVHLVQPPLKTRLTSMFSQVAWDPVQTALHSP